MPVADPESVGQRFSHLGELHRFAQTDDRFGTAGGQQLAQRFMARDDDHRGVRLMRANIIDDEMTVAGHDQIADDGVEYFALEAGHGSGGAVGRVDDVTDVPQQLTQRFTEGVVIVDDEQVQSAVAGSICVAIDHTLLRMHGECQSTIQAETPNRARDEVHLSPVRDTRVGNFVTFRCLRIVAAAAHLR